MNEVTTQETWVLQRMSGPPEFWFCQAIALFILLLGFLHLLGKFRRGRQPGGVGWGMIGWGVFYLLAAGYFAVLGLVAPLTPDGSPLLWLAWLALLGPLVVLLVTYVIWKYVRDCQAIGWLWGLMLMFLRCCVYLILVLAFLRPALQPWEVIQLHSRVALGLDTSLSMSNTRDDVPTDE